MLLFYSINRVMVSSVAMLNVGEAEKAAQAPVKAEDVSTAESCGCNKPCNCPKAAVGFSDLYSTGKPRSHRYHNWTEKTTLLS